MKGLFVLLIILTVVCAADAAVILTLNGVDLANGTLEIGGNKELIVAVGGETDVEPNDYCVSATTGVLEEITEANGVTAETERAEYLFRFNEESDPTAISLTAERDMIIDGISVGAGNTIYQLFLLRIEELNIVCALGADLQAFLPPEAEPTGGGEAEPEAPVEPEPLPLGTVEEEDKKVPVCCAASGGSPAASPIRWGGSSCWVSEQEDMEGAEPPGEWSGLSSGGGMLTMGMEGVIDITDDITSNTIWTADNSYHVLNPIDVNNALLVIEPGTVVGFAAGTSAGIRIINGGTLISVGTPDEPVVYTSDAVSAWYGDYYCPIYIEESASVCTKVAYSHVEYAYAGIVVINNRLDTSIESNWLFANVYGIVEYGTAHSNIYNNLIVGSFYGGIEVYLESLTGEADGNSHILIENNTCDGSDSWDAISVYGVDDANDAGFIVLSNNIASNNGRYGVVLADGYMYASVLNTGHYGNAENKNWDFEEDDPVIESANPYREGIGWMPYWYVGEDCNFIDAGYQYIEETGLIGKTTDANSGPDSNYVDVGFHYPNWNFSNAGDGNTLESDFNRDLIVNFADFAILSDGWQTSYDMNDLATLAGEWVNIISAHPNVSVTVSGDPNNLSEGISIGVAGYGVTTERAFVLLDGEYIDESLYFIKDEPIVLDSCKHRNGQHLIKIAVVDSNGVITVSEPLSGIFNNVVDNVIASDFFYPSEHYRILGFYAGPNTLEAKVTDAWGAVIWSESYTGSSVDIVIPGATFSGENSCEISIEESGGGAAGGGGESGEGSSKKWKKKVHKKYKKSDFANVKMIILLPHPEVTDVRWNAICEVMQACELRNVTYGVVSHHDVSRESLTDLLHGSLSGRKYVYYCGHANSHVGRDERRGIEGVQRTHIMCWEKRGWPLSWVPGLRYRQIGAFSFTQETYPEAPLLPNNWDARGFDLASLGLFNDEKIQIIMVDGCLSALYADLAWCFGMFSDWNAGHHDQIYIGWRKTVLVSPGILESILCTTEGVRTIWEELGKHRTIIQALGETDIGSAGACVGRALWGGNGLLDIGDIEGDDNMFCWGEGLNDQLEP